MHPPVGDFSLEDKESRHEFEIQGLSLLVTGTLGSCDGCLVACLLGKVVPRGQKEKVRKPKNPKKTPRPTLRKGVRHRKWHKTRSEPRTSEFNGANCDWETFPVAVVWTEL